MKFFAYIILLSFLVSSCLGCAACGGLCGCGCGKLGVLGAYPGYGLANPLAPAYGYNPYGALCNRLAATCLNEKLKPFLCKKALLTKLLQKNDQLAQKCLCQYSCGCGL